MALAFGVHVMMRLMQVSAALGPQEVVQECLTALRKADIERCAARIDVLANLPDLPSLVLTMQALVHID